MDTRNLVISGAVASLIALGAASGAAQAADAAKEKCFGIVKAAKNDCAANGHSCAGQAKTDGNASEWVYVPTGTCERIVGASLTAKAS